MTDQDKQQLCGALRENHRLRQDLHCAEKSLTQRVKAICRRLCGRGKDQSDEKVRKRILRDADVLYAAILGKATHEYVIPAAANTAPLIEARAIINTKRLEIEKYMERDAKKLPIWPWVESISGFGALSLAGVVGEAGDLSNYATHSKLWKRLGLAVIDGERQRKCSDKEKALIHGYSPSRRSVIWNIGQCVFKAQSARVDKETGEILKPAGFYREVYDQRKVYELERTDSKIVAHNRATRYMEKKLMRELWKEWRAIDKADSGPVRPMLSVVGG